MAKLSRNVTSWTVSRIADRTWAKLLSLVLVGGTGAHASLKRFDVVPATYPALS